MNIGWSITFISFISGIIGAICAVFPSTQKVAIYLGIAFALLGFIGWLISPKNNVYTNFFDNHPEISGGQVTPQIQYPIMKIGATELQYSGVGDPFNFGWDNSSFKVWIENGQLRVTSSVSDSTGKIVAVLENNQLTVNGNNALDFNWDNNAIEVIDQYNRVVLQVQLSGDVVSFAGIFALANNQGTVAIAPSPEGNMAIEMRPSGYPITTVIPRIFQYPGSTHLHERVSTQ